MPEIAVETYTMVPASKIKKFRSGLVKSFIYILIGMFILPPLVFAAEPTQSYDRESIRYPSMYTGQIWAKIGAQSSPSPAKSVLTKVGGDSSPNLNTETGNASPKPGGDTKQVSANNEGNSSPSPQIQKSETTQGTEVKKRLKKKSSQKVRVQNNKVSQATAVNNKPLPLKKDDKESQKTPADKPVQAKKIVLAEGKRPETVKADKAVKNWHHKQELFDIDCSEKLARVIVTYYFDKRETILKASQTPDAQWYHIYPGSFEDQLYIEICNPHL
ncbi:MAG TPA: hypothetical protein VEF33_03940 [Syntrophales bacterium]|nr:hypothetical protein [Syntrophales bacterium]